MVGPHPRQRRHEQATGRRLQADGAYGAPDIVAQGGKVGFCRLGRRQQHAGVLGKEASGVGEPHAAAGLGEQPGADLLLQQGLAYDAGVSPGVLLLVRFTLAAVLLGIVLLVRPALRRAESDPHRGAAASRPAMTHSRLLATALGLGAIGYATQASLFFSALQLMDASLLALILYTYPALVTVTAVLLGRDRLSPARGAALVVASGGTLLVLLGAGGVSFHPLGALLAFASAITYTVYILVADTVVHQLAPVVLSALVMTGAAGTLGARAVFTGAVDLDFGVSGWFWLTCIAVVSTVVAMLSFFAGLKRSGPSTAAILSTFEPVVTTALAALILGESLTPVQLAGGALVLSSAAVLQLRRTGTRRQDQDFHPASDQPDPTHQTRPHQGR